MMREEGKVHTMNVTVFYDVISTVTSRTSFVELQNNLIPHLLCSFTQNSLYLVIISLVLGSSSKLHTSTYQCF